MPMHHIKQAAPGSFGKEGCKPYHAADVRSIVHAIHRSRRFYGKLVHITAKRKNYQVLTGHLYQLLKKGTTRRYALANGAEYYDTSYTPQHSPRGAVAGCGVLVGFSLFLFIVLLT